MRTRDHSDVDIAVLRKDQESVRGSLRPGWRFSVVVPHGGSGTRRAWRRGERLEPPIHEIHAERYRGGQAEFLLQESTADEWVYRRDDRIRRSLDQIGAHSLLGLPVIAPDIALLFKAKAPREVDIADLVMMLPSLQGTQLSWLRGAIGIAHPDSPFLELLPSN